MNNRISGDVFEWDDATQKIVEKAVENRELDNTTENLKRQADEAVDKNFNQFNFDQILRDRDQVIKSIQQVLGPKLESLEKRLEKIEEKESSERHQKNRSDNAIDTEMYDFVRETLSVFRESHSQLAIWAYLAHANSQDIAEAVDIRQMQADQNEALKMVNEHYSKFEDVADKISRQVSSGVEQGMRNVVEEVVDAPEQRVEELEEEVERKDERIEELQDGQDDLVDPDSLGPLTEKQFELYEYVRENPDAEPGEIADNTSTAPNQVPQQIDRIKEKGWPI